MTITCNFATIATTISNLTITGVTIKNISTIPASGNMITPVLFPNPHFITNVTPEVLTTGGHPTAMIDFNYSLNYVYLHCPVGSGISQLEVISGLMTNFVAIVAAITGTNFTGKADVDFGAAQDPGVIQDPSGNQFWGVMFSLTIKDKVQ